jgi:hypothetical protein
MINSRETRFKQNIHTQGGGRFKKAAWEMARSRNRSHGLIGHRMTTTTTRTIKIVQDLLTR